MISIVVVDRWEFSMPPFVVLQSRSSDIARSSWGPVGIVWEKEAVEETFFDSGLVPSVSVFRFLALPSSLIVSITVPKHLIHYNGVILTVFGFNHCWELLKVWSSVPVVLKGCGVCAIVSKRETSDTHSINRVSAEKS